MKKIIKFSIWLIWSVLFIIFLLFEVVNNTHIQRLIIKKSGLKIKVEKAELSLHHFIIYNLNFRNSEIKVKNVNINLKYSLFGLLKLKVAYIGVNIGDITILGLQKNTSSQKKLTELELPKIPKKYFEIGNINIKIKSINVSNFQVKNLIIKGNVIDKKIKIEPITVTLDSDKYKTSNYLRAKIEGKLYKNIKIYLDLKGKFDKYRYFLRLYNTNLNLKNYTIVFNAIGGEKNIAQFKLNSLTIKPFKKHVKIKIRNFNINKLNLAPITSLIKLENYTIKANNLDIDYYLNNTFNIHNGDIRLNLILKDFKQDVLYMDRSKIQFNMALKSNNGFIKGIFSSIGKINGDKYNVKADIDGTIDNFLSPKMMINTFVESKYKKNTVSISIKGKGNLDNFDILAKLDGVIDEKIADNSIKSNIVGKFGQQFGKNGKIYGSGNIILMLKEFENKNIKLKNQFIKINAVDKINSQVAKIRLKPNNNFMNGLIDIKYQIPNKDVIVNSSDLTVDLEKFPLNELNIKDIKINSGKFILSIPKITIKNMGKINGTTRVILKSIALQGNGLENIYKYLLEKNIINVVFKGDLKRQIIQSQLTINNIKSDINGDYKIKYSPNNIWINGKFNIGSKKGILPIYNPFLIKGVITVPITCKVEGKKVNVNGSVIFNKFNVISPNIKVDQLDGMIPFDVNLQTIFNTKLPPILEKPVVELTPEEQKRYNLTINRVYFMNYMLSNIKVNINFFNYLNVENFMFNFALGVGKGALKYNLSNNFWLNFDFTNGYIYELLKYKPKDFSKKDTKVDVHALIYGDLKEYNGYIKMPKLGKSVLLNILYIIDPQNKDPQIVNLKNKIKFFGYYPELIDISLDGSTMSLYIPLKKKGFNPLNIPFSLQNIPIKKIMNSMTLK